MTVREIEKQIWLSKGFDRRMTEEVLAHAPPAQGLDLEIPEIMIPLVRERLERVINETIEEMAKLRSN